jgi:hypothetical protein
LSGDAGQSASSDFIVSPDGWSAVQAIAAELRTRKTISGADVAAIYLGHSTAASATESACLQD